MGYTYGIRRTLDAFAVNLDGLPLQERPPISMMDLERLRLGRMPRDRITGKQGAIMGATIVQFPPPNAKQRKMNLISVTHSYAGSKAICAATYPPQPKVAIPEDQTIDR